jgi:hypothetical protein
MAKDSHFSSDFEAAEMHRRSHGEAWRERLFALFLALIVGVALVWFYNGRRVNGEQLALGKAVQIKPGVWNGTRINVHTLQPDRTDDPHEPSQYIKYFPPHVGDEHRLWLWLGNSQLHSINQLRENDEIAPVHASRALGFPVFGLSLPNACVREHYLITAWALQRSHPQWVLLAVVFDKMRDYDIRSGFAPLLDQKTRDELSSNEVGRTILAEVDAQEKQNTADIQGTSRGGLAFSPQEYTEKALNTELSAVSQPWRDRDQMYAAVVEDLYSVRNFVFRIKSNTKRPIIASRLEANMNAMVELLELCKRHNVKVLVYVAPTRWDVEPPYFLDKYEAWKPEVERLAQEHGAYYADLDKIVPDRYWGTVGGDIDFMHFQGPGHEILAQRILEEVAKHEPQKKAEGKN